MFVSDYVLLQQGIPNGGQVRPPCMFLSDLLAEDGNRQKVWVRGSVSSLGPAQRSHQAVVTPYQCRHDN